MVVKKEKNQVKVKTLYQRISDVMSDVQHLSKDSKISFGTTNYKAISEEKVTSVLRNSLIKHGLVILPFHQEHTMIRVENEKKSVSNFTTVNVKYKIVDVATGKYEVLASSGTGVDTQDKGVGKAMTYAYKYMLLRTFAIPTGEDPDKISSDEIDADLEKQRKELKSKEPKTAGPDPDDAEMKAFKDHRTVKPKPEKKEINDEEKPKTVIDLKKNCSNCSVDCVPAVVEYSKKHFNGRVLCRDCQDKARKGELKETHGCDDELE